MSLTPDETCRLPLSLATVNAWCAAYVVLSALAALVCVCGMLGNGAVVWLLGFRGQRNPFCVYILNLAAADFLFLLCMASMISVDAIVEDDNKKPLEVVRRVKYFAYTAGLGLLTVISVQRCLSVLFPIWYKVRRPRHLSTWVCILLWVLALLLNILVSFFCSRFKAYNQHQCSTMDTVLGIFIVGFLTPVMTLSSLVLLVQIQRRPKQWRRRPARLAVVILASVLVFLVCSLPLGIYWFILYWSHVDPQLKTLLAGLSRFFSSLGSSSNPFIYFLVGRGRRSHHESLGVMLRRALQEEQDGESKEMPSTDTIESQAPTGPAQGSPPSEIRVPEATSSLTLPCCPCGLFRGASETFQAPVLGSLLCHAPQPPTGGKAWTPLHVLRRGQVSGTQTGSEESSIETDTCKASVRPHV
ncbi:PREDICTED: mas-related G-protein coupled receptor member D [Elephantulus edwardii]|uniref:mas-related G-protein coupled receptor member D n=1 Tax=Elephantulus edwardii TaxID=28737 RepID=UPI0003F0ABA0|nr:PREDICTED: mas-related G-protein coupled receptor member D [Elephantulus edwardii]